MNDLDKIINWSREERSVGEDFEAKVFTKIRHKKIQRRVVLGTSVVCMLLGFLVGFFFLTTHSAKGPELRAGSEIGTPVDTPVASTMDLWGGSDNEEIPLLEDVYFSSYDRRANYAVERVVYTSTDEDETGI
jgi:hypothetical protein